jgi:ketol-acid reductoisomerase
MHDPPPSAAAPAPPTAPVHHRERDLLAAVADRSFAVIGYGNQGRAHALNLRDSGLRVRVGARPGGRGEAAAIADGFTPGPAEDAASAADLVILGLPDEEIPRIVGEQVLPRLRPGATLGFMHGFAIHYGRVQPPAGIGVAMVAPKGPGDTLRERFAAGSGIPGLLAVHAESAAGDARTLALGWAAGIGCARAAIIETTFAAETETDLFGEQAVLCGGLLALLRTAHRTLVAAGYPEDLAYMECVQELRQVTDLLFRLGPAGMLEKISNTAEFGAHAAAERLLADGSVQASMDELLAAIRDGRFAERFAADHAAGFPWFSARRAEAAADPIEATGQAVRNWMPPATSADSTPPAPSAPHDRSRP